MLAFAQRREGVTPRRMRDIVNDLLSANTGLEPADGVARRRALRLDQALDAAREEMRGGNAAAIDRLIRVLREFERHAEIGRAPRAEKSVNLEAQASLKR